MHPDRTVWRPVTRSLAAPGLGVRTFKGCCQMLEADGSGVTVHAGKAPSIAFMAEATERSPRAPAPGLRLLIATAATFPVCNTFAIAVTSSSMLRPFADGVDALGTNRGS